MAINQNLNFMQNVIVANALVSKLSLWDSRGYDAMGEHSQDFLRDFAENGGISLSSLNCYIEKIEEMHFDATWLKPSFQEESANFIKNVKRYKELLVNDAPKETIEAVTNAIIAE